jgi:putative transposase
MRYVELNPVRAKLVSDPSDYRWSSYRSNGFGVHDRLIVPHSSYLSLGESSICRQQTWRELCGEAIPPEELFEIREALRCSRALKGVLSDAAQQPTEPELS